MYSAPGSCSSPKRFAVLIDADNESAAVIQGVLNVISKFGSASVKRMYGDWTTTRLAGWKSAMLEFSIQPIQQFAYTQGKNATDSALIIDAMDLLYSRRFDGFCIVSSDSDFTRLASRIREEGLLVYGFGQTKTPVSFKHACDAFFPTEGFRNAELMPAAGIELTAPLAHKTPPPAPTPKPAVATKAPKLPDPRAEITRVLDELGDAAGWVSGAALGTVIKPKLYGHGKLINLLAKYPTCFELDIRNTTDTGAVLYARNKPHVKPAQISENSLH